MAGGSRRRANTANANAMDEAETHAVVLRPLMTECQRPDMDDDDLERLRTKVLDRFASTLRDGGPSKYFLRAFVELTREALLIPEPSAPAEALLTFAVSCALETRRVVETTEVDQAPPLINTLLLYFANQLYVEAVSKTVRLRTCQFYQICLNALLEAGVQMDDDCWDKVEDVLLSRLADKIPRVQCAAIRALNFLQNIPENCRTLNDVPVIKALTEHMLYDPSAEVRATALENLNLSKLTLEKILSTKRDTSELVRKTFYQVIRDKVSAKVLRPKQRMTIFACGLNDKKPEVVKAAKDLLFEWLEEKNDAGGGGDGDSEDVVRLLGLLECLSDNDGDVRTVDKVLHAIFTRRSDRVAVDALTKQAWWDADARLPLDANVHRAFYWRALVEWVRATVADPALKEELLARLLPDGPDLLDFVEAYIMEAEDEAEASQRTPEERQMWRLKREIACRHFLRLLDAMGDAENHQAERRRQLLEAIISRPETTVFLLEPLVTQLLDYHVRLAEAEGWQQRGDRDLCFRGVEWLTELIGDLIAPAEAEATMGGGVSTASEAGSSQRAQRRLHSSEASGSGAGGGGLLPDDVAKRALAIAVPLLGHPSIFRLTEGLRAVQQELVLPSLRSVSSEVREAALKALGLTAVLDHATAANFFPFLVRTASVPVETIAVREMAMKAVLDIIMVQPISIVDRGVMPYLRWDKKMEREENDESSASQASSPDSRETVPAEEAMAAIVEFYLHVLESSEHRLFRSRHVAAEALTKLLVEDRATHHVALGKLLIAWFNPDNEGHDRLKQCLSSFHAGFTKISRRNQEQMAAAFWPALDQVLAAQPDDPLGRLDLERLGIFVVNITAPSHLAKPSKAEKAERSLHADLGLRLLERVRNLTDVDSTEMDLLLRLLGELAWASIAAVDLQRLKEDVVEIRDSFELPRKQAQVIARLARDIDRALALALELQEDEPMEEEDGDLGGGEGAREAPDEDDSRLSSARPVKEEAEEELNLSTLSSSSSRSTRAARAARRLRRHSPIEEEMDS